MIIKRNTDTHTCAEILNTSSHIAKSARCQSTAGYKQRQEKTVLYHWLGLKETTALLLLIRKLLI